MSETIHSTEGLIRQYRRSSRLRPEDEMEVHVLTVAQEESKLKLVALEQEQQESQTFIETIAGLSVDFSKIPLPPFEKNWISLSMGQLRGAEYQLVKAEVNQAEAELNLQKSQVKSDITVGPRMEVESDSQTSNFSIGATVSLPLSVYSSNEMEIAKSRSRVRANRKRLEMAESTLSRELLFHHRTYSQISKAIKNTVSNNKIDRKHSKLHQLIERGVVSAGAVIELHRQITEYHETLNQLELKGISSLMRIKTLEGNILKENF